MKTREELIQTIDSLYPADAPYTDTAETGEILLLKAIKQQWRNLPIDILNTYAQLCIEEERAF